MPASRAARWSTAALLVAAVAGVPGVFAPLSMNNGVTNGVFGPAGDLASSYILAIAHAPGFTMLGGYFASTANAGPSMAANCVARWDGSAFSPLVSGGVNGLTTVWAAQWRGRLTSTSAARSSRRAGLLQISSCAGTAKTSGR